MNMTSMSHFKVSVNGTPLGSARTTFKEVILQSGLDLPLPLARFTLEDVDGSLRGKNALVDGTIIELEYGKDDTDFKTIELLVFTKDTYDQDNVKYQQVFCILNLPNLIFESSFDVLKGTSVDAIRDLFDKVSFEFNSDLITDDTQRWINCGETKLDYINRITTHSYVDDKSCIYTAIDFDKAYTKDLFKVFDEEVEAKFIFQVAVEDPSVVLLKECVPRSRSGFLNAVNNYGQHHQQHSLDGGVIEFDSIDPILVDGTYLPMNADVKASIINASHSSGDFYDTGTGDLPGANVHKNYQRARYQNLRYYSLFSEAMSALTDQFVDPPLLSGCDIQHGEVRDGQPIVDAIHSGQYVLTNKTLILRGNAYAEKYQFLRHFLTEEGSTNVVAGSPEQPSSSSASSLEQILTETSISPEAPLAIVPEGQPDVLGKGIEVNAKTKTGNKIPVKASTVLDNNDKIKEQVSSRIKSNVESANSTLADSAGLVQSNFDATVEKFETTVADLETEFKESSLGIAGIEIQEKYGKNYDGLDALLDEFQSALDKVDMCKMLNDVEKLSLKIVLPKVPDIIDSVNSRLGKINNALAGMNADIDNLIENGDIDESDLDLDKHGVLCDSSRMDQLKTSAAENAVKDACLDDRDLNKLNIPMIKLLKKNGDLQRKLKDLLCSMGQ